MAVLDNIDTNAIIKGIQGMATQESGGVLGGQVGAVLLGALLPRLLGTGLGVDGAVAGHRALDANDVQNIVTGSNNTSTLGTIKGEIWQAEGQVQNAISQASNTSTVTTLQAEIANLQGQSAISTAIADVKYLTANEIHESASDVIASSTANTASVMAGMNMLAASLQAGHSTLATDIADSKYATTLAVMNDGDKTRSAIAALSAALPNARELDLQRQLGVAQDLAFESRVNHRIDSGNVNVTTNVNQNQAQAQQQQQLQLLSTNVALLGVQQQHATNLAINTGGNQRFNGSATNVAGV